MMRVAHHTVRRGETLATVANRYSTQPLVVRQLNDLDGSKLVVGSKIRVPSGSTTLPDKVARAAARVDGGGSRRGRIRGGSRPSIHVVRRGDSLWAIAKRTGIDVRTLARLNGLKPNEKLRMGDRLVLAQASGTPGRSARASGGSSKDKLRYRVRRGDTLYRIARIYNVSVTQLRSWNNLASAS